MAATILDIFTLFGPVPPRGAEEGLGPLQALLQKHQISGAVTLSTRGLFYSAAAGNRETIELCGKAGGALLPAGVLDPRLPSSAETLVGARMICLLPSLQKWPLPFAPLADHLRDITQNGGPLARIPLWWQINNAGDATLAANLLRDVGFSAPVVLGSVSGEQLVEAMAVAKQNPNIHLATNNLRGVGEISLAVKTLGGQKVLFASGAPARSLGAALALVEQATLPDADCDALLSGNARRILSGQTG